MAKEKAGAKVKEGLIEKSRYQSQSSTIFLVMAVIFFGGCAPLFVGAGVTTTVMTSRKTMKEAIKPNQDNFKSLTYGISEKFAMEIMGQRPFKAYEGEKEILIKNPYKIESIRRRGKAYKVIYYATDVVVADGVFTDDELTPLIFEQEVLIGWGWDFWDNL